MRKRNPDRRAQEAWRLDRSNHEAFRDYIVSFARNREKPTVEEFFEIERFIDKDGSLFPYYRSSIALNYRDIEKQTLREDRWREIASDLKSTTRPEAVLILITMGVRAGIPLQDVYAFLGDRDRQILREDETVYVLELLTSAEEGISLVARELSYDIERKLANNIKDFLIFIPALIDRIEKESHNMARLWCIRSINYMSIEKTLRPFASMAIPALTKEVNSRSNDVIRALAARTLGQFGELARESLPEIVRGLGDEYPDVRMNCAEAIGFIGTVNYTDIMALMNLLQRDRVSSVRESCAKALGMIGSAASFVLPSIREQARIDLNFGVREDCLEAIRNIESRS